MNLYLFYQKSLKALPCLSTIPALLIRLYLAPTFIMAGLTKTQMSDESVTGLASFAVKPSIIDWFGNAEWGLGLPLPDLLAYLATYTELIGGFLLLVGLFTRLISLPLLFTMFIAMTTVHLENGWFAITPTDPQTSPAVVYNWVGIEGAAQSLENSAQTAVRLDRMRDILENNGNTDWLYQKGPIVVLNNGIEFAMTYFIMLLALIVMGPGRWLSVDHYLNRYAQKRFLPDNQ